MKPTLLSCGGLWLVSSLFAQGAAAAEQGKLTDPLEILKKADAAAKAVKSVSYTVESRGLGANETRLPRVEGSVVLSGWTAEARGSVEKWHYDVKIHRPDSSETRELEAGTDGETFFLIDKAEKKAYEDIDPAVVGSAERVIRGITMAEFLHPTPFNDEITAKKQELRGVTKVGDEECYEIFVQYANPAQEANWFFSTKDFLPRRVQRWIIVLNGDRRGSELTITHLRVAPTFAKSPFKLTLPEGFTKIDDFAP